MQGAGQCGGKLLLKQRLAAGERDPAAGLPVEGDVLQRFGENLLHGQVAALSADCARRTCLHALAAERACMRTDQRMTVLHHPRLRGTQICAAAAAGALFPIQRELGVDLLGLPICTPAAAQLATLEEDRRPDARPIVQGEFLNVEDMSAHCTPQNRLTA